MTIIFETRKSNYLRTRLVPQPKIKIQDPQDPTPLQDFQIQDPAGSHAKSEFLDPRFLGSHAVIILESKIP